MDIQHMHVCAATPAAAVVLLTQGGHRGGLVSLMYFTGGPAAHGQVGHFCRATCQSCCRQCRPAVAGRIKGLACGFWAAQTTTGFLPMWGDLLTQS
jgi:hypothetical protein